MKIDMPYGARCIIEELNKHGFEAYIVGGCVRDCLLGKAPNDWDITTDAKPEQMKEIFRRTVDTGIQHGTVTVLIYPPGSDKPETYEVTTYRVDGVYEDHRRPKDVTFTSNLEEDLKRRDFTINAMAYNDEAGIVDIFGGIDDLDKGIIRCVGIADERFDEDALRILRAVRFAAQLDFDICKDTENAISTHAKYLKDISAERIQVELTKLITSNHPERLVDAYKLGLTSIILPEFDRMLETKQNNPYHKFDVGMHTIEAMKNVPATKILRYAVLLHDSGKPDCKTTDKKGIDHFYNHPEKSSQIARMVLRRLKLDNNTIEAVCRLVQYHDYGMGSNMSPKTFRNFLAKLGRENFSDFIAVRKADIAGQSGYNSDKSLAQVRRLEELYEKAMEEEQAIYISDLKIGGKELIGLGLKPGKEIGYILNKLLDEVIDEPSANEKEYLIKRAKELMTNSKKE